MSVLRNQAGPSLPSKQLITIVVEESGAALYWTDCRRLTCLFLSRIVSRDSSVHTTYCPHTGSSRCEKQIECSGRPWNWVVFVIFEGAASTSMSDKVVEQQGKAPLVFNKSSSQNRPQISHEFRPLYQN